jgi:predicted HicB family RNase H-like nuclease
MVHVRLDPELHRRLRVVVAADDTTVQDWIAHVVASAVQDAWPPVLQKSVG